MDVASVRFRVNMNEEEEEACAYGPKWSQGPREKMKEKKNIDGLGWLCMLYLLGYVRAQCSEKNVLSPKRLGIRFRKLIIRWRKTLTNETNKNVYNYIFII